MDYEAFALSAQGESHIRHGKECQDASYSFCGNNAAVIAVCDGHGGSDYVRSALGAEFACEVAAENIRTFLESVDTEKMKTASELMLVNLEASIISGWNEKITAHYAENPFSADEMQILSEKAKKKYIDNGRIESAYGTTLLAAAVTEKYWFAFQIGDGKCVVLNADGKFEQPVPWNDKCFLNTTTSMCDSEALSNFRHFYSEKLPAAVFLCSDGIDDSFDKNEKLNSFYKTILSSFSKSETDDAVIELREYLPRLSAKGSGDDVSLAAFMNRKNVSEIMSDVSESVTE